MRLSAIAALVACAAVPSGRGGKSRYGVGHHALTLKGRVEAGSALGDTFLRGYRVTAAGALEDLPAFVIGPCDEGGRFSVVIEVPPERPDLIIVSHSRAGQLAAVIGTRADVDGVVAVPILDEESTVEAQLYGRAHAERLWRPQLRVSRLRGLVTEALAHAVLASPDYDVAVAVVARAAVVAMLAWDAMLAHPAVGVPPSQMDDLRLGYEALQAIVDLELLEARDLSERRRAEGSSARWLSELYAGSGLGIGHLAAAATAAAEALHLHAAAAPPAVRVRLGRTAELLRARYTAAFVTAQARGWGNGGAVAELEAAGDAVARGLAAFSGDEAAWVRMAWEPFRRATTMRVEELGAERARALRRRIEHAVRSVDEQLLLLKTSSPPDQLAAAIVQALAPVVPLGKGGTSEEDLFRSLSAIELPGR